MARSTEYDEFLGAEAAVALPEVDDGFDPYGPLEADEASWFAVAGGADERDVQTALARLFGG